MHASVRLAALSTLVTGTLVASFAFAAEASPPLLPGINEPMNKLVQQPSIRQALDFIEKNEAKTVANTKTLNAIPAPTFQEGKRASAVAERFKALGLEQVHIDDAGNAMGTYKGNGSGPTIMLAAHLDTVYPTNTDLTLSERDGRLYAPGIADNARSLAAILTIVEAMKAAKIQTDGDIIFCGNVGEEGLGDLKGVKHIFAEHKEIKAFVGLEPALGGDAGEPVTYLATGSRRYKINFKGPGGHSYEAFGLPSAIHALGRAVARIDDLRVTTDPKVTFNVGVIEGGQSVNTIAGSASMLVDMRSEDKTALQRIEKQILAAVQQGVEDTNQRWNSTAIKAEPVLIGDRPAGKMSVNSPIVQVALAAAAAQGRKPALDSAHSTDANLPMSLGIPAITMSGGGSSSGIHSAKNEWWAPVNAHIGPQNVLLTILGLSGVQGIQASLLDVTH
ncbi:M20/M25/M40 family metallo-hydrolase [Noviherbaspirillum pedocola]|uniref:M20/M25/M40 family metallo-hydrolase n=1 Tax=Noviherbaspirillum pedocola TaxID=2801341 RepID=A0A934W838_9BURK|nr:M20/M25/M40 family metallo-hydrolase [Noviherbaspirillum pedocola]MBK4735369.1 M20/M25/M40 family metallo-hydrolase [Noviherbaspirillum pedocola]